MRLREALDLCSDDHAHEWVEIPGGQWGRPATTMLAGLSDPGGKEPDLRPLYGHSIAAYEPDARLSLLWPVDEEPDAGPLRGEDLPEWAAEDTHEWKSARPGWVVILLNGTPIWQQSLVYIDWGSGVGGYVPHFDPVYGDDRGTPELVGWSSSRWAIGLAGLINSFSHTASEFAQFDPTHRLVPQPDQLHPIDARREGR